MDQNWIWSINYKPVHQNKRKLDNIAQQAVFFLHNPSGSTWKALSLDAESGGINLDRAQSEECYGDKNLPLR
jgi:hypothetical protein